MTAEVQEPWQVAVVGAGAAGLLAAARAAERGRRTVLIEKNTKPGVKILISGGTRCNLTHATDERGIVDAFGPPGRFLHSALAALPPRALVDLIESEGVATKIESTGKIFPVSDRALDVLSALVGRLNRSGCRMLLDSAVESIEAGNPGFRLHTSRGEIVAEKLLITTGGQSYPGCGTTGDAYRWAAELGHTIVAPRPALVPVTTDAAWVRGLQGVTIPDAQIVLVETSLELPPAAFALRSQPYCDDERKLDTRRGSLLLTHFGLSGPVALDISREISGLIQPRRLALECDFLPAMKEPQLDAFLSQQAAAAGRKQLASILPEALPRRLVDALLAALELPADRKAAELSKRDRARLVEAIKHARIPVSGTRGYKKAEVTAGGVALDEIDSRTMASKIVPNLYFAGEVLDLDGPIGGYNFQAAFSTGWLAGSSV